MNIWHLFSLAFSSWRWSARAASESAPARQFGSGGLRVVFALLLPVSGLFADPGELDDRFQRNANSTVYGVAMQPDGKILVVGQFTSVGGTTRNRIARLNADGTLDTSFDPGADGAVGSVAIQSDGKILVMGSFGSVGGMASRCLARVNPDGTPDTGFDPRVNGTVFCAAPQSDGKIIVAGEFTRLGTTARTRIARLNADGTVDASFDPNANNTVYSLALQTDGKILIGGYFSSVGGATRSRIARLNSDGTLDGSFNQTVDNGVFSLAVQPNGKILVGGYFTRVAGTRRNSIARLNADGTLDTGFNPDANGSVDSIALQADSKIVLGGFYTRVGGAERNNIARLNPNGMADLDFNPNASSSVNSVAIQSDGQIVLGGQFTTVGGTVRQHLARLENDAATQTLAALNATRVKWSRGGAAPEVSQVTFELWTNSARTWTLLGDGRRVSGGWELTGLALPASGVLRARGRTTDGISSGLIQQVRTFPDSAGPIFVTQPSSQRVAAGQPTQFNVSAAASSVPTIQWQRNGRNLTGKTGATLAIATVQPGSTGIYTAVATSGAATTTSDPAILGVLGTSTGTGETAVTGVIGDGAVVLKNVTHPNGKSYDQVLLNGAAGAVTPPAGRVTRTSFIDLDDDIVQVEFAGAGTLSLVLDSSSPPAKPVNYTQDLNYMKGHMGLVIVGADETTNVSVFSVGRATAYDPTPGGYDILQSPTTPGAGGANDPARNGSSLFVGHAATAYDGIADIAFIAISSTNGKFGSVRTANANFFASKGLTGLYAPGVKFEGPVYIGDISAYDDASPVIVIGSTANVTQITGGDLYQDNGEAVRVSGLTLLKFVDGQDSHGRPLPAQSNRAALRKDGVDVTAQIVVKP